MILNNPLIPIACVFYLALAGLVTGANVFTISEKHPLRWNLLIANIIFLPGVIAWSILATLALLLICAAEHFLTSPYLDKPVKRHKD